MATEGTVIYDCIITTVLLVMRDACVIFVNINKFLLYSYTLIESQIVIHIANIVDTKGIPLLDQWLDWGRLIGLGLFQSPIHSPYSHCIIVMISVLLTCCCCLLCIKLNLLFNELCMEDSKLTGVLLQSCCHDRTKKHFTSRRWHLRKTVIP